MRGYYYGYDHLQSRGKRRRHRIAANRKARRTARAACHLLRTLIDPEGAAITVGPIAYGWID